MAYTEPFRIQTLGIHSEDMDFQVAPDNMALMEDVRRPSPDERCRDGRARNVNSNASQLISLPGPTSSSLWDTCPNSLLQKGCHMATSMLHAVTKAFCNCVPERRARLDPCTSRSNDSNMGNLVNISEPPLEPDHESWYTASQQERCLSIQRAMKEHLATTVPALDDPPHLASQLRRLGSTHPSLLLEIRHMAGHTLKFQYLQECVCSDQEQPDHEKMGITELWAVLSDQDKRSLSHAHSLADGERDPFFLRIVEEDRCMRTKLGGVTMASNNKQAMGTIRQRESRLWHVCKKARTGGLMFT